MKFIEISLETHNTEDSYYKFYKDYIFYTLKDYTDTEIKDILKSIKPKQFEDTVNFSCGELEIDKNYIIEKLASYGIYPLQIDVSHYYDIEE